VPKTRPPLRLLNRTPAAAPAHAKKGNAWGIITVAVVTLICCLLLVIPGQRGLPSLKMGDTPLTDVIAPYDVTVLDSAATASAQNRARESLPTVYDLLPAELKRLEQRVHDTFNTIRGTRFPGGNQAQGGNGVPELLRNRLGLPLVSADETPTPAQFTRRLERELTGALRLLLERGVLADRNEVAGGQNAEILIRTVGELRENYVKVRNLPDLPAAQMAMGQAAMQAFPENPATRHLMDTLGQALLFANLMENPGESLLRREAAAAQVKPLHYKVMRGEVIIAGGTQVLRSHQDVLSAFGATTDKGTYGMRLAGLGLLCGMIFYVFFLDLRSIGSRVLCEVPRAFLTGLILVGTLALCRLTLFLLSAFTIRFEAVDALTIPYALPVAAGAMLVTLLLNVRTALVFSMMASILMGLMVPESPLFTLYGFVTSLIGIFAVANVQRRSQLARAGLWVGFISAGVVAGIDLQQAGMWDSARLYDLPFAFAGGLLSGMIVSAVLPVIELVFNVPTNIRLLELSNLNHRLLRNLLERAPGTYHHSMIMSNMAEQAAKSIDENALLARVGCYYHDIGKMAKPDYFIENQWGGANNLHDKLTPSMSRLVLVSHVKDGIELARKYKLPEEVIDMIPQHHGTRLIGYFYSKAKQRQGPETQPPDENSFRYPGPKPQSKVAAIIMLADTVEASSRVLEDPSPARLAALVDKVVSTIYLDQQLDECDLTLKDMRLISESFVKALTGTFHHRIQYPGMAIPGKHADSSDQPSTPVSR
jgi:putative nucleotidyltransferase with HDIG domain